MTLTLSCDSSNKIILTDFLIFHFKIIIELFIVFILNVYLYYKITLGAILFHSRNQVHYLQKLFEDSQ